MRKFLTFILTLFLTIWIVLFAFTLNLKEVISDNLITSIIKDEAVNKITDVFDENVVSLPENTINEIKKTINNNEEINDIINKYVDKTIESIGDDKSLENIDVKEDLRKIVGDHKQVIEEELGVTISDKDVDKVINRVDKAIDLDKTYKEIITSQKSSIPKDVLNIISIYSFLISNTCKYILIGLIIATILLIMVTRKTLYRWIYNLGISGFIGSILLFIGSFVFGTGINYVLETNLNTSISIEVMPFIISSFVIFGISILLLIINLILKIALKKED